MSKLKRQIQTLHQQLDEASAELHKVNERNSSLEVESDHRLKSTCYNGIESESFTAR